MTTLTPKNPDNTYGCSLIVFLTFSGDFVYITDRAYTESQIREMEIKILAALGKIFMLQAA